MWCDWRNSYELLQNLLFMQKTAEQCRFESGSVYISNSVSFTGLKLKFILGPEFFSFFFFPSQLTANQERGLCQRQSSHQRQTHFPEPWRHLLPCDQHKVTRRLRAARLETGFVSVLLQKMLSSWFTFTRWVKCGTARPTGWKLGELSTRS